MVVPWRWHSSQKVHHCHFHHPELEWPAMVMDIVNAWYVPKRRGIKECFWGDKFLHVYVGYPLVFKVALHTSSNVILIKTRGKKGRKIKKNLVWHLNENDFFFNQKFWHCFLYFYINFKQATGTKLCLCNTAYHTPLAPWSIRKGLPHQPASQRPCSFSL